MPLIGPIKAKRRLCLTVGWWECPERIHPIVARPISSGGQSWQGQSHPVETEDGKLPYDIVCRVSHRNAAAFQLASIAFGVTHERRAGWQCVRGLGVDVRCTHD